jgi:hypothetical protein
VWAAIAFTEATEDKKGMVKKSTNKNANAILEMCNFIA